MVNIQKICFFKVMHMLTTRQLYDIEQLQKEVETHDVLKLKLNWEMLRARDSDQLDFFHYENDKLIAFLGLYSFGSTVEVTGMVKPCERRKGHFTQLFVDAMAASRQIGYKKILLNAPASPKAAKDFLKKQGATYKFSEHQMQWQPQSLDTSTGFILRQATIADLDMRVRLNVEAFDIPQEDAMATESRINGDEDTDMLMIDVNNETIGKIRVKREDGQAWIYGFSILPEHQGKGIGRKVLHHIAKHQSETGHSVHLEVETKNAHALSLYEAVGFIVMHTQDYYIYEK
jgi:ribosomal protein S18 acetylase RimI-like enzyme